MERCYTDTNDKEIVDGSILDIHQTVNGENLFVIFTAAPLDIRYGCDLEYKYEYDMEDLLVCGTYAMYGETDVEIVGNFLTDPEGRNAWDIIEKLR